MPRNAAVHVDLDALAHNVGVVRWTIAPAELCAVVKADGYGHGAVGVARTALEAGATWLATALVEEALVLRDAGITAPVLVLSEPPPEDLVAACAGGLTPTIYTRTGVQAAASASAAAGTGPWPVHVKVDTGMHRVGVAPTDALELIEELLASGLALGGVSTHLAVADERGRPETDLQLRRYREVLDRLEASGVAVGLRHVANSAGGLLHPPARFDLVRAGIALYGVAPSARLAADPAVADLRPVMSVRAWVTLVKSVAAGEGVSYGLQHRFDRDAVVATVPVGYADGIARGLGLTGGEVLIGGVRRPIRGVVTMDQLVVEVTDGPPVGPGDEVVLLGRQGAESIDAQEWAGRLDTIGYEVVCRFGPRLPRVQESGP